MDNAISSLKEKAELSFQTLAVVFLGWLAASMATLNTEIKELNLKMSVVVTQIERHSQDIISLEKKFEYERVLQQQLKDKIWDEINKIRYKLGQKDSKRELKEE